MQNTTKAVLASTGAAVLLLGGLGSLAYWQDGESIPESTLTSGTLDLSAPDCGSWATQAGDVSLDTFRMVPGDRLTRTCEFTVDAAGDNLRTELTYAVAPLSGTTLLAELELDATYALNGGTPASLASYDNADPAVTDLDDGDVIAVTYDVALPFGGNEPGGPGVDNESNSGAESTSGATGLVGGELTAVLSQLTLTVTQVA